MAGHVFVFLNRRKTQVKLPVWTRGGYTVVHKRLERGTFAFPRCDGELVRARLGDKVVDEGRLGSTLVAQLLVDKYDDGLPLHRQKAWFARMGLDATVSTLADQVTWSTDLLRPLWRVAIAQAITARIMHLDGTALPVLDHATQGGKRVGTLRGYIGRHGDHNTAAYLASQQPEATR